MKAVWSVQPEMYGSHEPSSSVAIGSKVEECESVQPKRRHEPSSTTAKGMKLRPRELVQP